MTGKNVVYNFLALSKLSSSNHRILKYLILFFYFSFYSEVERSLYQWCQRAANQQVAGKEKAGIKC